MKTYEGVDFRTRYRGVWLIPSPGSFITRERAHAVHCTAGLTGPRAALDAVEKKKNPSSCRLSNPGPARHPVATQSKLSRLSKWRKRQPLSREKYAETSLFVVHLHATTWIFKLYFLGGGRRSLPKYWELLIQTVWHERLGVEAMWEIFSSEMIGEDFRYTHIQ
jgi:hypothetical protein